MVNSVTSHANISQDDDDYDDDNESNNDSDVSNLQWHIHSKQPNFLLVFYM